MNWAQFKDPVSHVSCWRCGSMVVSYTRGGWVTGSNPFNVINFFVTEFTKFSEKHLGKTPLRVWCCIPIGTEKRHKLVL